MRSTSKLAQEQVRPMRLGLGTYVLSPALGNLPPVGQPRPQALQLPAPPGMTGRMPMAGPQRPGTKGVPRLTASGNGQSALDGPGHFSLGAAAADKVFTVAK